MTTLLGFSPEQVCRLTGLSDHQLRYWDNTGFFSPWRIADEPRRSNNRVYSFRDVVGLRTIAILRNTHHVPLQELRKVGEWLAGQYETPWASLVFFVGGRQVYFGDPSGVLYASRRSTQTALRILLSAVEEDVNGTAKRLQQRSADDIGQIHRNRFVVSNAHCMAGTRIPTRAIATLHRAGYSAGQIIAEYPRLTAKDVAAAIEFEEKVPSKKAG